MIRTHNITKMMFYYQTMVDIGGTRSLEKYAPSIQSIRVWKRGVLDGLPPLSTASIGPSTISGVKCRPQTISIGENDSNSPIIRYKSPRGSNGFCFRVTTFFSPSWIVTRRQNPFPSQGYIFVRVGVLDPFSPICMDVYRKAMLTSF